MKFKSEVQLEALNNATVDTDKFLVSDSSTVKYRTGAEVLSDIGGQAALTNPITGTGTLNYVSKFTSATTLGNSQIFDDGSAVGIGTTSVSNGFLNVYRSTSGTTVRFSNPSGYVDIGPNNTGGAHIYTDRPQFYMNQRLTLINGQLSSYSPNNLSFMLNSGASTAMTILNTNGNVGIGTTVPDTLLHVSSLNSSILRLESTNTALGLDAVVGEIQFEANDASASGVGVKGKIGAYSDTVGGNAIGLRFFTGEAGVATATEKMRISATGNVGIGTTVPTYKLQIVGDVYTSIGYIAAGNCYMNSIGNTSTNNNANISLTTSGVRASRNIADSNTAFAVTQTHASSTGAIQTWNNSAGEKMRITSSGNVGIGTTSPSETLHVNGNLKIADGSTTKLHITDTILNGIIEYNGFMIDNTKTRFGIDVGSSLMIGVKADTHAYFINSSQEAFGLSGSESGLIASNSLMQGSPGDPSTITNWIQIKDENGNKFYLPLYQ
jgi:hypothetical protein